MKRVDPYTFFNVSQSDAIALGLCAGSKITSGRREKTANLPGIFTFFIPRRMAFSDTAKPLFERMRDAAIARDALIAWKAPGAVMRMSASSKSSKLKSNLIVFVSPVSSDTPILSGATTYRSACMARAASRITFKDSLCVFDVMTGIPGLIMPAFSAAIFAIVFPSSPVWSFDMSVSTETSGITTFVESSLPPSPVSMIAISTFISWK